MYISEVSGHHSATLAIENAIKLLSPKTEVLNINAFNYTNPVSEKIVNHLYMGIIKRTPQIWKYLYDNPKIVKRVEKIKQAIHKLNSPKLKLLFDKFEPDAVACTQAFPCGMVADYKKTFNSSLPLVAVLTDYIPHSYWVYDAVDYYVTPSDDISQMFTEKKVPLKKIKSLGIPFDQKFNEVLDREKLFQKLNLSQSVPAVLIMGGGQGIGPIKTIVRSLEKVKGPMQEIVVTGTNKKLYNSLKRRLKKYKKKISLYGFVGNIHELMCASDIIITKPGGVTTAEVLAKKIPMVIVKPIPGQEASNTAYLTEKGAAIKVDDPKKTNLAVEYLLKNPAKLNEIRELAYCIAKPNASMDIARLLLDSANG